MFCGLKVLKIDFFSSYDLRVDADKRAWRLRELLYIQPFFKPISGKGDTAKPVFHKDHSLSSR